MMTTATLKAEIDEALTALVSSLKPLTAAQANTRPSATAWSPAQIGQHLLKSYDVHDVLYGNTTYPERPIDEQVAEIDGIFLNFDAKYDSPQAILPSEKIIDKDALIAALEGRRTELLNAANELDLSLVCTDSPFPGIGNLTRYEWLQFIVVHTQRHLRQLERTVAEVV